MEFWATQWMIMLLVLMPGGESDETEWGIQNPEGWRQWAESSEGVDVGEAGLSPANRLGVYVTRLRMFSKPRLAQDLELRQSAVWQNWEPIENLGPANLGDAPVMLTIGPNNYWMFGRYGGTRRRGGKTDSPFHSEEIRVEGYDMPLRTTPFADQYDAPGGLKPGRGGYHAWQSRDMKTWIHHGPVTEGFSKWVTSAEWVDGRVLIYYDFPNDQDPHVYVDENLFDGEPGTNRGIAVRDPSHGSDAGFIRDLDGNMHVILEDWSPISANKRSWDSPLAAHAVSRDGLGDFRFLAPPVDRRTNPTGRTGTYRHPHWAKEDPQNYKTNVAEFEIHEPEQEAFGDWAAICIGGQYYLFGDYDPAGGGHMSVGWFTSPSIDQEFSWCDHIGNGHPDPDVAFAEGRFYLATQQKTDYVSPGPWVEKVEVRVGVDTDGDGKVDHLSQWQEVRESYDYIPGFAKQVARKPAKADLSGLPPGYGFQLQVRLTDTTQNKSKPILEQLTVRFVNE